jgi:hypothetical protein
MDVLLAIPQHGALAHSGALRAGLIWASEDHCIQLVMPASSLLPKTFNLAWCTGLKLAEQRQIDLFAMLHDDIVPEPGWLDKLVAELERTGCDVLSCVVPIKDPRGIASTAIDCANPEDHWHCEKRLTMHEVMQLPETFTAADCGFPDRALLINTGCWVCRIRDPRFRLTDEGPSFASDTGQRLSFAFDIKTRVMRLPDGNYQVQCISEDWDFGRWLHRHGFDVRATRVVSLEHFALSAYPNNKAWGSCKSEAELKTEEIPCA